MGIPSIGIYAYELFNNYNVDYIIRIGTIGAYDANLQLGDVILAKKSYTDSSFAKVQSNYEQNYLNSSPSLNNIILETAKENNYKIVTGNIFTSDVFYEKENYQIKVDNYKVLGVEMETFGLLHTARIFNKNATALLTVSNSFKTLLEMTAEQREKNLNNMIELVLKSCLKL
jgi:purine-nucleoside phosphorylase